MNVQPYPLAWPEIYRRTAIKERKKRGAWKKTSLQYIKELEDELRKFGATTIIVTSNVPQSSMGTRYPEPRDAGVAVHFTKPPNEDDFSWQEILGINHPDPKTAEIEDKFRALSQRYHPDNQATGDVEMFKQINTARQRARAWVSGDYGREHEHVIACDAYAEVRLNIAALRHAMKAVRMIEDSGCTGLMERVFKSFEAIAETSESAQVRA